MKKYILLDINYPINTSIMNEMQSMFSNPETVVLNQLFSVVNESFKCKGGTYNVLRTFSIGVVRVIATLVVQNMFKKSDGLYTFIKYIALRLIYRKIYLYRNVDRDALMIDQYNSLLTTKEDKSVTISGIPLYLEKEGNDNCLYYISYVHTNFIQELENIANRSISEKEVVETVCRDTNGREFAPLDLFASNNYLKLDDIICTYFEVYNDTKMVTPPLIVINGLPGLGKSHSSHFIAKLSKYGEVRYIDLTASGMVNESFSTIVSSIMSRKTITTTVIYFDELDKYVDMYIQHTFTNKDKAKGTNMDEVIDADRNVFERAVKKSIISTITQLNNNFTNFSKGVVFIFCSNNFHTLFDGLDQTHIESAKTRFTFIDFVKCNKEEFIRYITLFNNRVRTPRIKYTQERLDSCVKNVRDDLSITYRDIQILHTRAAYDMERLIEYMNEGVVNPLRCNSKEKEECIPSDSTIEEVKIPAISSELVVRKVSAEDRRAAKANREKLIIDVINVISDMDIGNEDCMNKVLTMIEGKDILALAETIIYEQDRDRCILFNVCEYGRVNLLQRLINEGIDVDLANTYNENSLSLSIRSLNQNSRVDKKNVLHIGYQDKTTRDNIFECIKLLVNAGINIQDCDSNGYTPLELFGYGDYKDHELGYILEIFKILVARGFDINSQLGDEGMRPLDIILSHSNSTHIIRDMIDLGVDVNKHDHVGFSYLSMLYSSKKLPKLLSNVRLLIELGADINYYNSNHKDSVMSIICKRANEEYIEVIRYLLESGIDKTLIDVFGEIKTIEETSKNQAIIDLYNSY